MSSPYLQQGLGVSSREYIYKFRTSPFKMTRQISYFSQRSLCLCGLKVIYLTAEAQRTQREEFKEEFIDYNFHPP